MSHIQRVFDTWLGRTRAAWRRERAIWKRTKKPPSERHITGAVWLLISVPAMWYVAFHTGWMVLLSFSFTVFLAISYATFFSKPSIFVFIYLGIVVGGAAREVLNDAKDAAFVGDWVSAFIVLGAGVYVLVWSNQLKAGLVPTDSLTPPGKRATQYNPKKRA